MASEVDTIKTRLPVADVIGSYIKLEKAGSNLKAKCPFHNEKTPSFFVSPSRDSYFCFGCGAKGDIFTFVQEFEGVDFFGALKILAARAGVNIVREDPKTKSERERLYALMEEATVFFENNLSANKDVNKYLSDRGVEEMTVKKWRLGYALDEWRACHGYLSDKGYGQGEQERAGLVKKAETKYYDRFRRRVMFPIFDPSGRPVAFSGRIFGKESEDTPKYLNSPETPLFSKSSILYGYDRAKSEIRRKDYSILVEGQVDLIMCHQAGFKNAVATSGTALTGSQLGLLKRLSGRILMVYDADEAGMEASQRSAMMALSLGMEVKVAALPQGFDPADLIRSDIGKWKNCLKSTKHVIDFSLDRILGQKLEPRKLAGQVRDKILPLLSVLNSSAEKSHFIKQISEKTGIKELAIYDDLKKISMNEKGIDTGNGSAIMSSLLSRKNQVERLLLGLLLWQQKSKNPVLDVKKLESDFSKIIGQAKFNKLNDEGQKISDELIFQAESYYSDNERLEFELKELLTNLEEDVVKEELGRNINELGVAEKSKDIKRGKELLEICHRLSSRLAAIKKKQSV